MAAVVPQVAISLRKVSTEQQLVFRGQSGLLLLSCFYTIVCMGPIGLYVLTNIVQVGKRIVNENIARIANAVQVTICLLVSTSVY